MSKERLLAAIMFTDITGYTALMGNDEDTAINIRERHRSIFEKTTFSYNGKIVQYFGDGTLSIFTSAVEAVQCGIAMQKAYLKEPKIPVRIGIHMGDILYSKDDIIGDAVNIASRIESGAVPGSVLISDKIHDQIRNHRDIKVKFLDAYDLKNVEEVIPIFAIANAGLVIPNRDEVKLQLKVKAKPKNKSLNIRKVIGVILAIAMLIFIINHFGLFASKQISSDKSIAVLPFENLSSDEDSEIFTDGITEDILTQLSKLKDLHVISRTSVMKYKKTKKSIAEIAKELDVTYILEGSIRKYDDDVRVTSQLIDAENDDHLWAENYDRTLTNIFSLQSEISQEIVEALKINLSFEDLQELKDVPTTNIEAYKLFLKGRELANKRNKESLAKSILLYKDAIALDPDYAVAYAEIANSIYLETYYSGRDPEEAALLANEYLEKAEEINPKVSRIYSVKGLINNVFGNYAEADEAFKKSIKLSPNDLTARHQYSIFFYYTRQYEKQLEQAEIAYRLDPLSFPIANSYFNALLANEEFERAETLMDKIQVRDGESNQFVIHRSYFRLFMDQKKYAEVIPHLKEIVKKETVFNRFLGYSYVKAGDTLSAYKIIDNVRKNEHPDEKSYQLAMIYAALKINDSVFYYLDTSRNKQTRKLKRESKEFFGYLNNNEKYIEILKSHGIE